MSRAVEVLVLDELRAASPTFRATLEHMPALQTIGEADLRQDGAGTIALVFVDEARPADGSARLAGLKESWPALRTLVAFQALTATPSTACSRPARTPSSPATPPPSTSAQPS